MREKFNHLKLDQMDISKHIIILLPASGGLGNIMCKKIETFKILKFDHCRLLPLAG